MIVCLSPLRVTDNSAIRPFANSRVDVAESSVPPEAFRPAKEKSWASRATPYAHDAHRHATFRGKQGGRACRDCFNVGWALPTAADCDVVGNAHPTYLTSSNFTGRFSVADIIAASSTRCVW